MLASKTPVVRQKGVRILSEIARSPHGTEPEYLALVRLLGGAAVKPVGGKMASVEYSAEDRQLRLKVQQTLSGMGVTERVQIERTIQKPGQAVDALRRKMPEDSQQSTPSPPSPSPPSAKPPL